MDKEQGGTRCPPAVVELLVDLAEFAVRRGRLDLGECRVDGVVLDKSVACSPKHGYAVAFALGQDGQHVLGPNHEPEYDVYVGTVTFEPKRTSRKDPT